MGCILAQPTNNLNNLKMVKKLSIEYNISKNPLNYFVQSCWTFLWGVSKVMFDGLEGMRPS